MRYFGDTSQVDPDRDRDLVHHITSSHRPPPAVVEKERYIAATRWPKMKVRSILLHFRALLRFFISFLGQARRMSVLTFADLQEAGGFRKDSAPCSLPLFNRQNGTPAHE